MVSRRPDLSGFDSRSIFEAATIEDQTASKKLL
jgi:hypothetical protein